MLLNYSLAAYSPCEDRLMSFNGTRGRTDLLAVELFYHKDKQAMKTFLYQLKALGFRPESITREKAPKSVSRVLRYVGEVLP